MNKPRPLDTSRRFRGVIAYLVTPFNQDGTVDLARLGSLVDRMVDAGIHGVSPLGGAGVISYLDDEEREAVTETVCRRAAGHLPVLVGVSSITTERTLRHARFAERAGADALLAMPMSDWKLTADEVVSYYDRLASAVSIPIMVYDSAMKSGGLMPVDLIARLAEIPNVTMLKDSSADPERLQVLQSRTSGKLDIFVGKNTGVFPGLALGCVGWCSATPLIAPRQALELFRALSENTDLALGRALAAGLFPLLESLVRLGLPRAVPACLTLLGQSMGPLREPLSPLSPAQEEELRLALDHAGLFESVAVQPAAIKTVAR